MTRSRLTAPRAWREAGAEAVEDRLFRALAVLRVVVLANAVALNLYRRDNFDHPTAGVLVVLGMAAWTGIAIWAFSSSARRVPLLLVLDLVIALAALASSPLVKGAGFSASVSGFWVIGALFAWAIHWRWIGGLVAATLVSATDLLIRESVTQANYANVFLIMIGGPIVGYMCGSLQRMAAERDHAERAAATAAERARLARAVHDGVLQVLSLVQRRGAEIGGEAAELGRLAGEQERDLRSLIHQQDSLAAPSRDEATDLASALERTATRRPPQASMSGPGAPVLMPAAAVEELVAVVRACLDNVARHVGPTAPAWVLLEDLGAEVVVTVRDEGPGIPDGRLDAAVTEGRLGVSESICGRIADLGGSAALHTGPSGTEWEVRVPR
ncbi:MacS family sensor histidine kinase [Nocardioides donggukensis]|uniref:Histidine kinase n=1 Tax=Nocardioides donggukensis TaxID=2774019 RepID=A0A927K7D6_9ACTN|nr:DUF5931 domain-containing protein [Nocardioides donggukensis]MBD8869171.1 histidine kinase [Nocardioides donggukensis]